MKLPWQKNSLHTVVQMSSFLSLRRRRRGLYVFGSSVRADVRPSVIHVVVLCFRDISSICWRMFAKLLSLVHLGTDELIRFWGQKVKVQGHTIAAEAHSTRRYHRVQLFLVYNLNSFVCCHPVFHNFWNIHNRYSATRERIVTPPNVVFVTALPRKNLDYNFIHAITTQ